jgi:putative transposase
MRQTFRCYPSARQGRFLAKTFGCVRFVFNKALRFRNDRFGADKTPTSYGQLSTALTGWKKEPDSLWLGEVSCVPLQQTLRHLQTAFRGFFEKRTAIPRFKSKHGGQSAEFTRSAFTWDGKHYNLRLAKMGHLRIRWSRQFASEPSTVTITKNCAGQYFVTLCLDENVEALPRTGQSAGIDLCINRMATLSNGELVANPRHLERRLGKMRSLQRSLSRRTKGSGRWRRQKLEVARLHVRIANCRRDHLDKLTTSLVRRFDVLCIEDLNVRAMLGNKALARAISNVGMGTFRRMITYKCRWYGRELRLVDRYFPSSKKCSECEFVAEKMPLDVREWRCSNCCTFHDRDLNAAKNIMAAGHAVPARGGPVRPEATVVARGCAQRSAPQPALP